MSGKNWVAAASANGIGDGAMIAIEIGDKSIALYRIGDEFYATDNVCSHAFALLTDGFVEGFEVECPLHGGRFDVRTGKGLCAPVTEDIKGYRTRVVDGHVQIDVAE